MWADFVDSGFYRRRHENLEWRWQDTCDDRQDVRITDQNRKAFFHGNGFMNTVAIKGDKPLKIDHHYYWEIKLLTKLYDADMVFGIGTDDSPLVGPIYKDVSLVGSNAKSYGLSNLGELRNNKINTKCCEVFCKNDIIGVRVDLWQGCIEFYVNRVNQGVVLYNLRQHKHPLYPMLCSKAYRSCIRLLNASSYRNSLLVEASKILASAVKPDWSKMPPGLKTVLMKHFWLTLPTETDEDFFKVDLQAKPERETETKPEYLYFK